MAFQNISIAIQVTTGDFERKLNEAAAKVRTFSQAAEASGTGVDRAFTRAAGGVNTVNTSLSGLGRQVGVTGRLASDVGRLDSAFDKASSGARKLDGALERTQQMSLAVIRANNAHATAVERVYLAEQKLAEVESRGNARQSQLIGARNALAQAHRRVAEAAEGVRVAEIDATKDTGARWGLASQGPDRYAQSLHGAGAASTTMFDRIKNNLTKISNLGIGFAVGNVIVSGFHRAVNAIQSTIIAGSDLNETLSKTGFTFGASAKIVVDLADEMAQKFGLNKREFIDNATSIGLIGKAAGLSAKEAATLGGNFAKLAADASSFYNVPVGDALLAIRSGLVGEAEPMRKFGVLLDETSVKNEGWRLGLAKTGAELSQQQKVIARSSLIQSGLADATGDLERTQNSLANRLRAISGHVSNFAANLGLQLQPAMGRLLDGGYELAQLLGDQLGPFFRSVGDIALNLRDIFRNLWESVGPLVTALGGLAALGVIAALNGIAAGLREVTGFLADNKEIVLGLAAVYTASLIPALITTGVELARVAVSFGVATFRNALAGASSLAGAFVSLAPATQAATAANTRMVVSQAAVQTAVARTGVALAGQQLQLAGVGAAATASGQAQILAAERAAAANTGLLATLARVRIGWLGIAATVAGAALITSRVLSDRRKGNDAAVAGQFGLPEENDVDEMRKRLNAIITLRNKHIDELASKNRGTNIPFTGKKIMLPSDRAAQDQIDAEGRAIDAQLKTYDSAARAIAKVSRERKLAIPIVKELAKSEEVDLAHGVDKATSSLDKQAVAFLKTRAAASAGADANFGTQLAKAAADADVKIEELAKNLTEAAGASGLTEQGLLQMAQNGAGGVGSLTDKVKNLGDTIGKAGKAAGDAFASSFDILGKLGSAFAVKDIFGIDELAKTGDGGAKESAAQDKIRSATDAHAKAVNRLTDARLKLNEIQSKGGASASQLSTAQHRVDEAQSAVATSAGKMGTAQQKAAEAGEAASGAAQLTGDKIVTAFTKGLKVAQEFVGELKLAIAAGLNPQTVQQLMTMPVEQAKPILDAIVSDSSGGVVDILNLGSAALNDWQIEMVRTASLTQLAIESHSDAVIDNLGIAMQISQLTWKNGGALTAEALALSLGLSIGKVAEVIGQYSQTVVGGIEAAKKAAGVEAFTAYARTFGSAGFGSGAEGALYDPTGVRLYARGGMSENHAPQIAPGRTPVRIWAEPETQGEAYIPLAGDHRRPRAEAILGYVADHFGGVFIPKGEVTARLDRDSVRLDMGGFVTPRPVPASREVQRFAAGGFADTRLVPKPPTIPGEDPVHSTGQATVGIMYESALQGLNAQNEAARRFYGAAGANAAKGTPGTAGATGRASGTGYRLLIDYLRSTGVQHTITSTTGGRHVPGSYHYRGLAVDVVGALSNIYNSFYRVGPQLAELFYDAKTSIKRGRNSPPIGGHDDHVHAAVESTTRSLGKPSPHFRPPKEFAAGGIVIPGGGTYSYATGGVRYGDSAIRGGDTSTYVHGGGTYARGGSTQSSVWSPSSSVIHGATDARRSYLFSRGGVSSVREGDHASQSTSHLAGDTEPKSEAYYATGGISNTHSPSSTYVAGSGPVLTSSQTAGAQSSVTDARRASLASYAGNIYEGARNLATRTFNYFAGGGILGPTFTPQTADEPAEAYATGGINPGLASLKQLGRGLTVTEMRWIAAVSANERLQAARRIGARYLPPGYEYGGDNYQGRKTRLSEGLSPGASFGGRITDPDVMLARVMLALDSFWRRFPQQRGLPVAEMNRRGMTHFATGGVRPPVVQVLGAGPLTSGVRPQHTSYAYGGFAADGFRGSSTTGRAASRAPGHEPGDGVTIRPAAAIGSFTSYAYGGNATTMYGHGGVRHGDSATHYAQGFTYHAGSPVSTRSGDVHVVRGGPTTSSSRHLALGDIRQGDAVTDARSWSYAQGGVEGPAPFLRAVESNHAVALYTGPGRYAVAPSGPSTPTVTTHAYGGVRHGDTFDNRRSSSAATTSYVLGDTSYFAAGGAAGATPGTATPAAPGRVHVYALGGISGRRDSNSRAQESSGPGTRSRALAPVHHLAALARPLVLQSYADGAVVHVVPVGGYSATSERSGARDVRPATPGRDHLEVHHYALGGTRNRPPDGNQAGGNAGIRLLGPHSTPGVRQSTFYALGGIVPVPSPVQQATSSLRGTGEGRVTHYRDGGLVERFTDSLRERVERYAAGGLVERLFADRSSNRTEHERLIERFALGGAPAPMIPVPGVSRLFPLASPGPEPAAASIHYHAGGVTRHDHANTFAARVAEAAGIRSRPLDVHVTTADRGGVVYPGTNVVYNNTGAPEYIANPNAPTPQPIRQAPVNVTNSTSTFAPVTTVKVDLSGANISRDGMTMVRKEIGRAMEKHDRDLLRLRKQG